MARETHDRFLGNRGAAVMYFLRVRLFALVMIGVAAHACFLRASASPPPHHWIADGQVRWREPVVVGALAVDTPKHRPAIVPLGTPVWPVLRHFSGRGEEVQFTAALAVRSRWREAVKRPPAQAITAADADSTCELAVYKVMAKRGLIRDQLGLRNLFEREPAGVSDGLRRTMMIWPLWFSTRLCVGPVRSVQALPSLVQIDSVAKRWSLDVFDAKCVWTLQEMARRNARVMKMLKTCNEPFRHDFVEKYVTITDKFVSAEGPTYRNLVHSYTAEILKDVVANASAEAQLAALDKSLGPWQTSYVTFSDIWTSLATGMLDCDALCLIAAEVLSQRGWAVRFEWGLADSVSQVDDAYAAHVILRIRPPTLVKGTEHDQSGSQAIKFGDERLYDPSPFPVAQPQTGKEAPLSKHEWKFKPYTAAKAAANEAIVRGLIPVAK